MQLRSLVISCVIAGLAGCGGGSMKEVIEQTHANGKPKKVSYYKRGKIPRRTVFYFEDGTLQSDQYFGKTGKPDSIKVIYAPSGQKIQETFYKDEKLNGTDKSWYDDGTLKSEASYIDDMPQGTTYSYFKNGKKASETPYKDGKKEGQEITYDSAGQKKQLMTYVAGNPSG
ncbi:MAG: toxin-antitoxin system YwqK family antitoxin, partial [Chitinispirillaceae bacterium]|nr:toxin-antitoxin system YwqK family antitoxin [Chitinispirillaceae bacterium]